MKKKQKSTTLKLIFSFLLLIPIIFHLTDYNHIYKAVWYNFVNIDDYKIFHNRIITKSHDTDDWQYSEKFNQKKISTPSQHLLDSLKTTAFLVIKDKKIEIERYYLEGSDSAHTNSFSVAKSYISVLIGFAIQDGKIKSLDQPISDFIESFQNGKKSKITVRDVLMMSSGLDWDESYAGPFSITTKAYYGDNLKKIIDQQKAIEPAGKTFKYLSGNTQVLAFVLKKATGKSLSEYATEKIWKPLGHEQNAFWSLDKKNGDEKAYCCISTNARDFARIGQFYLDSGKWNNKQLLNKEYILESIIPNGTLDYESNKPNDYYGLHWWLIPHNNQKIFYARGILGQYIIVIPEKKIVIVRLGHVRGERRKNTKHYEITYAIIDEVNRLFP